MGERTYLFLSISQRGFHRAFTIHKLELINTISLLGVFSHAPLLVSLKGRAGEHTLFWINICRGNIPLIFYTVIIVSN